MKVQRGTFKLSDLERVEEIPLDTCLTHVLGHTYRAGAERDAEELAGIDAALATLRAKVAEQQQAMLERN